MSNPLVTIITVSYKAVTDIENTILSVINQTYSKIEFIIIDGGSTDGTVEIIKKYSDKISYWVSKPDTGIYDAMNKGVAAATGDWINFMNVGDTFIDNDVLTKIFSNNSINNFDVVYGDTRYHDRWGPYIQVPNDIKTINNGLPFCHQSSFVKTQHLKHLHFNLKYTIAADFDFFYSLYKLESKFLYLPLCIANFQIVDSFSRENWPINRKETLVILGRLNSPKQKIDFFLERIFFYLKNQAKKLLTEERKLRIRNNNIANRVKK